MAIRDLLWACPLCTTTGGLRANGRGDLCQACGAEFRRNTGAAIQSVSGAGDRMRLRPAQWLERLPPRDPASLPVELGPERVALSVTIRKQPVRRGRELIGWLDRFGPRRHGSLRLTRDRLRFDAPDDSIEWPLDRITAVQPTSSKLQIAARHMPVAAIRFETASVRLWEEAIREAVRRIWLTHGRGEITEFHPRIYARPPGNRHQRDGDAVHAQTHTDRTATNEHGPSYEDGHQRGSARPDAARRPPEPAGNNVASTRPEPFYRAAQWLPSTFWRALATLDTAGVENIPATGPFLLISNHQSNLDPILIQAVCPRRVHAMAKSSQFAVPVIASLMKRLHAFPVRRYQADPQAVRTALRRLAEDEAVAIYVEGERTWDGNLQPPRPGTIRLALKAGVPIVPATISGSYDAWPRWDSRIQRRPVTITFGPPFRLPHLERKADREAALPSAAATIMAALRRQLDGRH